MIAQPFGEVLDFGVAPHPGREAAKRRLRTGYSGPMTHIAIYHRGIRPVSLDRHNVETMLFDQPPGDQRACTVELGGAVAGFAQQHHLAIGVTAEQLRKMWIIERGQRFCCLTDQAGQGGFVLSASCRRTTGHTAIVLLRLAPAMLAYQWHKSHSAKRFFNELVLALARYFQQLLRTRILAYRHDEPAAYRKLLSPRFWYVWAACRSEDDLERRCFGPAQRAIAGTHFDIGITQARQSLPCGFRQAFVPFYRINFVCHARKDGRGISATGANFQHAVVWLDLGFRNHQGDDKGLGDGLVFLDGQRHIIVGKFLQVLGNEHLARRAGHGVQQALIADAAMHDLPLYHEATTFGQVLHSVHASRIACGNLWPAPPMRFRAVKRLLALIRNNPYSAASLREPICVRS